MISFSSREFLVVDVINSINQMTILQGLLHFSGMNLGNGTASNAWWYMKTIPMSYNTKKVSEFVCKK